MISDILQPTHLIIVLVVVLLVLGPKRLPSAGRALGHGLREFKGSLTGEHGDGDEMRATPGIPRDAARPSDAQSGEAATAADQ